MFRYKTITGRVIISAWQVKVSQIYFLKSAYRNEGPESRIVECQQAVRRGQLPVIASQTKSDVMKNLSLTSVLGQLPVIASQTTSDIMKTKSLTSVLCHLPVIASQAVVN